MHSHTTLWAGLALAGLGWILTPHGTLPREATPPAAPTTAAPPPAVPEAVGHYTLVVEGDRDHLAITHARWKPEPWAGVPKGLASDYRLAVLDVDGHELASVLLDLSKFDLRPEAKGSAVRSEGCTVLDARVAMLANAPCHGEQAAAYVFYRGAVELGRVAGAAVRDLAGGGK
jgi:hypothetical protein